MEGVGGGSRAAVLPTLLLLLLPPPATGAYDLDPCVGKSTYTPLRCPVGTELACWSAEPSVPWHCWSTARVPLWLASGIVPGDTTCQAWALPGGAGDGRPRYYDGACAVRDGNGPPVVWHQLFAPPLTWGEAYERARATLAQMGEGEKHSLMHGTGWYRPEKGWWDRRKWWYVGNTPGIPRLGVPSLNMQDAAAGFSPFWTELVGTVTCWPSSLALAATWDPSLVQVFGMALAREFAGKGANVLLGPSVNVHRVARNGRNFEYLTGEDPYLGSRLVEAYVKGVQSQGVMAVVKHWVFNEQETNRGEESSEVDDKTAWELYYPPFQAAVDAGVSAAMCSYNRVDGVHSCSNSKQLHRLKERMGFQGFVQSDWWAAHRTSVAAGLDQDMPGIGDPGAAEGYMSESIFFSGKRLRGERDRDIDEAVTRILAAMYRVNVTWACSPPHCGTWFQQNVTSPEHAALARTIAAESVVLLKNDAVGGHRGRPLLPLSATSVKTIAIIGSAAVAKSYDPHGAGQGHGNWAQGDLYSGGGSGHVPAGYVVTPLEGIRRRATIAGLKVLTHPSNSITGATEVASQADVTIIVAGTTSGESADRLTLSLDDNADTLISMVAARTRKVVVLIEAPGAVVMPWRKAVPAILMMFLGGQETGSAWASVLFGDHAPTGRLPIMIPDTEMDTIPPGVGADVVYSEGMETSYRNKSFKAAFPFSHGLTYTTFEYLAPSTGVCVGSTGGASYMRDREYSRAQLNPDVCVQVTVQNSGSVAARTIAQLYLDLGPEARHPVPLLKGFQKTNVLLPGASVNVTFRLTPRDLSYYDVGTASWVEVGAATAHIGESFADIRHRVRVDAAARSPPAAAQPRLWLCLVALLAAVAGTAVTTWLVAARQKRREVTKHEELCCCCCSDAEKWSEAGGGAGG